MKILMTIVLALSMCICTQVDAVCVSVEPACAEYTEVDWYPGKYVIRGGARVLRGAARGTAKVLRGTAKGVGRAVASRIFKVTVVTDNETVIFYRVAVSKDLLNARLKVNAASGYLLVRTPKGIRLIPSGDVKSVTVVNIR